VCWRGCPRVRCLRPSGLISAGNCTAAPLPRPCPGLDLFVREHAITAAADPLVDSAYLGLLVTDANLRIVGARREPVER